MSAWAERLSALGRVVRLDYPYMRAGRRTPDRLPALIEAHRAALIEARAGSTPPTLLIGKSMGGRVGCHLALEEPVSGLICLGYPLKAPGKSGARRDQVLRQLETPVLFIQGSLDPLCPLAELQGLLPQLRSRAELHVVAGGNHSLEVGKRELARSGRTQDDVNAEILGAITGFVRSLALEAAPY